MGEATAAIAASMPDRDFLAVDVHAPGVGSLLGRSIRRGSPTSA
jgi:tRNA (guanine-N7-)-methyltransferase